MSEREREVEIQTLCMTCKDRRSVRSAGSSDLRIVNFCHLSPVMVSHGLSWIPLQGNSVREQAVKSTIQLRTQLGTECHIIHLTKDTTDTTGRNLSLWYTQKPVQFNRDNDDQPMKLGASLFSGKPICSLSWFTQKACTHARPFSLGHVALSLQPELAEDIYTRFK